MLSTNQKLLLGGSVILVLLVVVGVLIYKKEKFTSVTSATTPSLQLSSVSPPLQALASDTNGNLSLTGIVPVGGIIMWSGSISDITYLTPNWQLCDGTNGTPDLRSRFIIGASTDNEGGQALSNPLNQLGNNQQLTAYQPNDYGGEETHTLTEDEMPKHTHGIPGASLDCSDCAFDEGANQQFQSDASTSQPTGNSQPHNNMPPFYALAFIIKMK